MKLPSFCVLLEFFASAAPDGGFMRAQVSGLSYTPAPRGRAQWPDAQATAAEAPTARNTQAINTTTPLSSGFGADYVAGLDGLAPGETARARATGTQEFRAGDGPTIRIQPDAQLQLERAPASVVMSWQEEGQPMDAAIPVVVFNEYLQSGKVSIVK